MNTRQQINQAIEDFYGRRIDEELLAGDTHEEEVVKYTTFFREEKARTKTVKEQ